MPHSMIKMFVGILWGLHSDIYANMQNDVESVQGLEFGVVLLQSV